MTKPFHIFFALSFTTAAQAALLTPAWVALGPDGAPIVRVVVDSPTACPSLTVDGKPIPMTLRSPVPADFQPACELALPAGAKKASLATQKLVLPKPDPRKVVVLGDTGCRIEGNRIQDCNDPKKWPFQSVATSAASAKPDVILHVGDYLYREDPCPPNEQKACGGSPSHDKWVTWNADFFAPAKNLLAAAPWVFSRGNHEDCKRAYRGWFYYLDPRPYQPACQTHSAPYTVTLGAWQVFVVDSSASKDANPSPADIAPFTKQLRDAKLTHAWLIDHHPFWGLRQDRNPAKVVALSETMAAAWEQAQPKGIDLILSGHTHLFEILGYQPARPPQIVAGDGGTKLSDKITAQMNGVTVFGAKVVSSDSLDKFGYSVMQKKNATWRLNLRDPQGKAMLACTIDQAKLTCARK